MEKNEIIETKEDNIEVYDKYKIRNMIYTIRGMQVMLDKDVAMLYHTETKRINQVVKRNIQRFPERFCFQLKESEIPNRWSQFVTTSENQNNKYRSKKYLPNAFTEQGIAMLSSLLKNDIAIQVSINIMDAFFEMRKFILNNSNMLNRLTTVEYKLLEHDKKFDQVFNELQNNEKETINSKIFYNGQIYDSYSLIIEIIKSANNIYYLLNKNKKML